MDRETFAALKKLLATMEDDISNRGMWDEYMTVSGWVAENEGFFPITKLSRLDLVEEGFDVADVDDTQMEELAKAMGEAYVATSFASDLVGLAEDALIDRTN